MVTTPKVVVAGAGPAGMMAAEVLATAGIQVTVFDRMPSAGRKFLMAGRGGLNLTHSEPLDLFLKRYSRSSDHLRRAIEAFPPQRAVEWAEALGQPVFTGTSGRVFPSALKASPLLRAWLARLQKLGVAFVMRHELTLIDDQSRPLFKNVATGDTVSPKADAVVLALGGASWPRLGSNGAWSPWLQSRGIAVTVLEASNCGVIVDWSPVMIAKAAGSPLKRIAINVGDVRATGEAVITSRGLEGGAVYQIVPTIRDRLRFGPARITIDLKPDTTVEGLQSRLAETASKSSLTTRLRKGANLAPAAILLLRETHGPLDGRDASALAAAIKSLPVTVSALAPVDRAISTAGGVAFDAINDDFSLRDLPDIFVAGEMLDWDAPTGGYLLQACLATGAAAADGILARLAGKAWDREPRASFGSPFPNEPATPQN